MTGLMIEAHDWPEDVRPFVRDVEMRLLKRAILYYPSTLQPPAASGDTASLPGTDPGVVGNSIKESA